MKKKKLTFNSLALGNLKHRKKRYTLMILGIILSMMFSSSIIYFGFSIYTTSQEQRKAELGLYDKFFGVFNEEMYECYLQVFEKSEVKIEKHSIDFFRGSCFKIFTA